MRLRAHPPRLAPRRLGRAAARDGRRAPLRGLPHGPRVATRDRSVAGARPAWRAAPSGGNQFMKRDALRCHAVPGPPGRRSVLLALPGLAALASVARAAASGPSLTKLVATDGGASALARTRVSVRGHLSPSPDGREFVLTEAPTVACQLCGDLHDADPGVAVRTDAPDPGAAMPRRGHRDGGAAALRGCVGRTSPRARSGTPRSGPRGSRWRPCRGVVGGSGRRSARARTGTMPGGGRRTSGTCRRASPWSDRGGPTRLRPVRGRRVRRGDRATLADAPEPSCGRSTLRPLDRRFRSPASTASRSVHPSWRGVSDAPPSSRSLHDPCGHGAARRWAMLRRPTRPS